MSENECGMTIISLGDISDKDFRAIHEALVELLDLRAEVQKLRAEVHRLLESEQNLKDLVTDQRERKNYYFRQFWFMFRERDDARRWAAAWKKAAKKKRLQAEGWSQLFRQRHEQRDEARAECTELANELGDLQALYMVILESAIGLGKSARLCQSVLLKGKPERDESAGSPV